MATCDSEASELDRGTVLVGSGGLSESVKNGGNWGYDMDETIVGILSKSPPTLQVL